MTFGVIWSNLITKARSRSQRTRKIEWHFFQWSFAMRMMMKAVVLLRRRRAPRSARHEGCEKKKAMSSSTSSSGKVRKDGRKEGAISVTRLGAFWKFLATYFLTKVAQIIGYYLGYCAHVESNTVWVKNAVAPFWTLSGKFGLLLFQHLVTLGAIDSVRRLSRNS